MWKSPRNFDAYNLAIGSFVSGNPCTQDCLVLPKVKMSPVTFRTIIMYGIEFFANFDIWIAITESYMNLLCDIITGNIFYFPIVIVLEKQILEYFFD